MTAEARVAVAERGLVAAASNHLTETVASRLAFEELGPFKTLLKRYFSAQPWSDDDAAELSALVAPHLADEWWEHDLGEGLTMTHGIEGDRYVLRVDGEVSADEPTLWDRVFSGPVVPEPTPHPHKVRFAIGGSPAPGRWYRRSDEVDDERVAALLEDEAVTDVMVAGDFVTVGLRRDQPWEERLDDMIDRVQGLFWEPGRPTAVEPERTRDDLVGEGLRTSSPEELHLLDPDDPAARERLREALHHGDAEVRRVAVATLAQSGDEVFVASMLGEAYTDRHRIVRRMAIDAAADLGTESVRSLFEQALGDADAWVRWKAVRGLREIGVEKSEAAVRAMVTDDDFQVRFEAAAALRGEA